MNIVPVPSPAPPEGPKLRDIHMPPSPSWWPPAPGWWVVAVLIVLALVIGVWLWRRRRHATARRRQVLSEVDRLAAVHQRDGDGARLAAGLHQLLRRAARRHEVDAGRQAGQAWRRTLARVPVDAAVLDRLLVLDELMYRQRPVFDHAAMIGAVKTWLQVALKPSAWKAPVPEQADV